MAEGRRRLADFDRHEWGVLAPLALVGFFSNYDMGLLTLAAPVIADGLGVTVAAFGVGVAIIRLAALGSLGTLRLADRWGRRSVLVLSVLGFTLATGLTAMAWGLVAFVVAQFLARIFLATEETLAGVVLTEELRPDRRGAGIATLGIISMTGFGLVAALLVVAESTPLGWRLFYVAALVPLAFVAYLRRNLRETAAFHAAASEARVQPTWWPSVDGRDRARLLRVTAVQAAAGLAATTAFFYAAELAQDDYGWEGLFSVIVVAAGPTTLLGYAVGGRVSDRLGRKPITAGALVVLAAGVVLVFTEQRWLFAPGFFLLAASDAAVQSARATFVAELFPTEVRATLASFVNAVTVAAGSLGLVLAGALAGVVDPSVTIFGLAAVCAASALALRRLPETAGCDVHGEAVLEPGVASGALAPEAIPHSV